MIVNELGLSVDALHSNHVRSSVISAIFLSSLRRYPQSSAVILTSITTPVHAQRLPMDSTSTLARPYDQGKYHDLKIVCHGREFNVHKAVVCVHSPVIAAAVDNFQVRHGTDLLSR